MGVICFMSVNLMANIHGCDLQWNISNSTFRLLLIKLMINYMPFAQGESQASLNCISDGLITYK